MSKHISYISLIIICLAVFANRGYGQMQLKDNNQQIVQMLPPTIIFKMNKKYVNCVPIALSEDQSTIVSYPDPRDITENSCPTPLKKGYFLDNRGIGPNTVFLNITYKEYAKLASAPNIDQMKKMIIKGKIIKKMYKCQNALSAEKTKEDLCKIIDNKFINCERIK